MHFSTDSHDMAFFFEGNLVFKDHDTDTHNDEALKMLNLANMDEDDFFDED
jgi:hypothetical protein